MHADIKQVGPADYEIELTESADALRPKLDAALKTYRGRVQVRGFRAGKVPAQMVRKLYGREIAAEIAEKEVQLAFEEEVLDNPEYPVIGRPALTRLEYDGDTDLRATVRFGIRPPVELQDLKGITLNRLVHDVTDDEVEEELEALRQRAAATEPAPDEPLGAGMAATIDLQQLDEASGTPLIGKKEADVEVRMDDENLKDELEAALEGKKEGDTFRVQLPHGEGDHVHTHAYQVTVKSVRRQSVPEATDEWAKGVSNGQHETLDALRADIRADLEKAWQSRGRDYVESQITDRLVEAHPLPVAQSALDLYLDSFVERLKDRYAEGGQPIPDGFDWQGFRRAMTPEAEKQARWMLIRDHLLEQEGIEVTDADYDAFFADAAGADLDPQLFRRYYEGMKGMMENLEQRLLSEKLFRALEGRFSYQDRTMDEVQAEMEARRLAEEAAPDADADTPQTTPDAEAEAPRADADAAPPAEEPAL